MITIKNNTVKNLYRSKMFGRMFALKLPDVYSRKMQKKTLTRNMDHSL